MECGGGCPCKQKQGETDSMKCCFNSCPADPKINNPYCKNLLCGKDGQTYKGACALSECGKTVSKMQNYIFQSGLLLTFRKFNVMDLVHVQIGLQPLHPQSGPMEPMILNQVPNLI